MATKIRPIREEDIESFSDAVDVVARERKDLYLTQAPSPHDRQTRGGRPPFLDIPNIACMKAANRKNCTACNPPYGNCIAHEVKVIGGQSSRSSSSASAGCSVTSSDCDD